MPHRALLLAATVLCSCALQSGEIPLYEDDAVAEVEGKADGEGLSPRHSVEGYETALEPRRLLEPLSVGTFLDEREIPAGEGVVVLRRLRLDGVATVVVADDRTFELGLVSEEALEARTAGVDEAAAQSFRYLAALERTESSVLCHLQEGSGPRASMRFALTVDMCQSSRAWEEGLFQWLVDLGRERGEAEVVGVAMTGLWAHRHAEELEQLLTWQREGLLDIRWINHSYHHQLSQHGDGSYHFLTDPSVDLTAEVVELEVLLLQQGVMFSPLFRFPGLTHDEATLAELAGLGLFPLDANGWVAKGEPIADGSVVLLHGNGNEHVGVTMFFDWVEPQAELLGDSAVRLADPIGTLPVPSADGSLPPPEGFATCAP